MGSIEQARIVGFICRLCSKTKRTVIHLYTAKGRSLNLLNKINMMLPTTMDKYDNLPKTICQSCIEKLDMHYQLLMRIRKSDTVYRAHTRHHSNGNCPVECPLHGKCE